MAKSNKVTVYVRRPGTRERERATNKNSVATGTTFCLRYMRNGKRCWETLENVTSFAQAQKAAIDRNVDLTVGRAVPVPEPRPEPSTPKPSVKTGAVPLDVAIDTYNRNVASRSGKTVSGYAATMKQFYASCRKPFVQDVTQQDLIDFVTYLRATGVGDRTISNRLVEVGTFLKASGVKGCGPVPVSSSLPSCQTTPPWLTVRMEVDGVSVCLLVDTGASGIFLFQSRIRDRLPLLISLGERMSTNIGGEFRLQRVLLATTNLGETHFGQQNAFVVEDQEDRSCDFDGLLGASALGLKQVAFDFQRHKFSWKR